MSGLKEEREDAATALKEAALSGCVGEGYVKSGIDKKRLIDDVRQALYLCSRDVFVEGQE